MHGYMRNSTILNLLNKQVYGHDLAKRTLINLINKSKLYYHKKWHLLQDVPKLSNNCLLIGGSGTGKTFLVETLRSMCPFPLFRIDATKLGPSGGASSICVSDVIKSIKKYARGLVEDNPSTYFSVDGVLDQMVVFVDEVDKLANSFEASGKWNEQIQSSLLTLLENNEELNGLSFILAGAFSGLTSEKKKRKNLGFTDNGASEYAEDLEWHKEIIKFGLIPEFVGRINSIVKLDVLTLEDYTNIFNNYILPLRLEELKMYYGMDFYVSQELRDGIIKKTADNSLGVRMMRRQLDELLVDIEFNYEKLTETKALTIL